MISRVAGWVATICGTLALVVGWIPIVGQALAAVLAGRAVRARRRSAPQGNPMDYQSPVTNLDIHVPVPGSSAYLLLSFSTPLDPLADALVGMFDAIAGTLRWIP
jgi:hypothetical protein